MQDRLEKFRRSLMAQRPWMLPGAYRLIRGSGVMAAQSFQKIDHNSRKERQAGGISRLLEDTHATADYS